MNNSLEKPLKTIYQRLLFPKAPSCPICGKVFFSGEKIFCEKCEDKLEWKDKCCEICGRELKKDNELSVCSNCINLADENNRHFDTGFSLFSFGKYSKKVVYAIKSSGRKGLGLNIGEFLAHQIDKNFISEFDIIVPVPMYFEKEENRGFNQANLIAKTFAASARIEYLEDALIKLETKEQKMLPPVGRNINMKNAIRINQLTKNALSGKRVLLIDDVYTTGATINTCAEVLKVEGAASNVGFATICSTKEI